MTDTVKGMGRGIQTQEGVCAQEPLWYAGNGGYGHKVGLHPRKVVEGAHTHQRNFHAKNWMGKLHWEHEAQKAPCGTRRTETAPKVGPTGHSTLMLTSERDMKAPKHSFIY